MPPNQLAGDWSIIPPIYVIARPCLQQEANCNEANWLERKTPLPRSFEPNGLEACLCMTWTYVLWYLQRNVFLTA